MQQGYAVEVRDVSKKFKIYHDKGRTLKEKVIFSSRNKYEERWVLKGISFGVKKGEAVGLIGHNGCGKSTTLKMLTKIMYPDTGSIELSGRVSSLLELGAGFHPDMSGRENIYINASIFGLTKKEIEDRMDEIIRFSELEEFIDNPVRTYSSGMYMRLAFSVAISVDADVLLIDEILGVGDVNFQTKCFHKLMEIKNSGTTIVLVSHSLEQIERICERSIWIHEGRIQAEGAPGSVHRQYLEYMGQVRGAAASKSGWLQEGSGNMENEALQADRGAVKITNFYTADPDGEKKQVFKAMQDVIIHIEYEVYRPVRKTNITVGISRDDGVYCCRVSTKEDGMDGLCLDRNGNMELAFHNIHLLAGRFHVDVSVENEAGHEISHVRKEGLFEIYTGSHEAGAFYLEHKWKLGNKG